MKRKIDHIDKSILRILQESADKPYKQMAFMVNSPVSTVCERIKKLKECGIIQNTVVRLDRKKLQQDVLGRVNVRMSDISKEMLEKLRKNLLEIPEVNSCSHITGHFNISIKVITTDTSRFFEVVMQIAGFAFVDGINTYIILGDIIPDTGLRIL